MRKKVNDTEVPLDVRAEVVDETPEVDLSRFCGGAEGVEASGELFVDFDREEVDGAVV